MPESFSIPAVTNERILGNFPLEEPEDTSSDEESEVIRASYERRVRDAIREPQKNNLYIFFLGSAFMLAHEGLNMTYGSTQDRIHSGLFFVTFLVTLVATVVAPCFSSLHRRV